MARLIRANSETPNVANNDDFRLLRYATGGYNGVVKNYGNECSYTVDGSNFKINSGVIVYQGIDTEILTTGETITVDNISGTQYYVVYLEIDLSNSENQTATIKSDYNTNDYPIISAGDDLTTVPNGIANFELYKFTASSGAISNVVAQFEIIEVGNVLHAENADLAINATNATNGINAVNQLITDESTKIANTNFVKLATSISRNGISSRMEVYEVLQNVSRAYFYIDIEGESLYKLLNNKSIFYIKTKIISSYNSPLYMFNTFEFGTLILNDSLGIFSARDTSTETAEYIILKIVEKSSNKITLKLMSYVQASNVTEYTAPDISAFYNSCYIKDWFIK